MKTIIVAVHTDSETVAKRTIVTGEGQPTTIPAQKHVNYELIDWNTGVAPDRIMAKRQDNDLHISLNNNLEMTDLIISDFYSYESSALSGLSETGNYYYYVPDTGEIVDYVTQLTNSATYSGHALGGIEFTHPWWAGEITSANLNSIGTGESIIPWLAGSAAAVAAGIALNKKDNSNNSKDNEPSKDTSINKPTITFDDITTDNTINLNESKDTIAVTGKTENVEDGTQITLTVGEAKYTGTVNDNKFSVGVDGRSLAIHQSINAELSTSVGKAVTDHSYQVDTQIDQPVITFDKVTADNKIDLTESEAKITVSGSVTNAPDGSELTLIVGSNKILTIVKGGKFNTQISGNILAENTTIEANIKIADNAGNTASTTAEQSYVVDLTPLSTPTITIDNVTKDNVINIAESELTAVPVTGKVTGVLVNTNIQVVCGCATCTGVTDVVKDAKVNSDGTFSVDFTGEEVATGSTITVKVPKTDDNYATENSSDYTKDLVKPEASISIDSPIMVDDIINSDEATNKMTLTGTISPVEADAQASVTVRINKNEYEATIDKATNTYSLDIAGKILTQADNVTAILTTTDKAGNKNTASTNKTYIVDTEISDPTITINDINGGNIINADTASKSIVVTGNINHDPDIDTDNVDITVFINGTSYDGAVINGNTWSLTLSGSALSAKQGVNEAYATVEVTDKAGNTAQAEGNKVTYQVDTVIDSSITLDTVTSDNVLSLSEANDKVAVSGKVTGEFQEGDIVTIIIGTQTITTTVKADGTFSALVDGSLLADNPTKTIKASLKSTDEAGNTLSVDAEDQSYTVQTDGDVKLEIKTITGDDLINVNEAKDTITLSGVVTGKDAQVGQQVTLTVSGKDYSAILESDLSFSVDIAGSELVDNAGYNISAVVEGFANSKTSVNYDVDDYAAASIDITSLETKGIIGEGNNSEQSVRLSGKLDLEGTAFAIGDNVTRVKAINLKVGSKTYHVGINEEDQTFYADVAVDDLINANGQDISYTLDTSNNLWTVQDDNIFYSYDKVVELVEAPTLNESNTKVILESEVIAGTEGNYKIDSSALAENMLTEVSGTVGGSAKAGDTVTVNVSGAVYTTKVATDKSFTVEIDDNKVAGSGKVVATLTSTDLEGTALSVSDSTNYVSTSILQSNGEMVNYSGSVGSYDDLYYFMQALDIEHYADTYDYNYTIGSRLGTYSYGNEGNTNPITITYHFATIAESNAYPDNLNNPISFSETNMKVVQEALSTISEYSDIKFVQVNSASESDMDFYMADINGGSVGASYIAGYGYAGGDVVFASEVYGDTSVSEGSLDTYSGYGTALHEIFHTLGFTHPFAESSTPEAVKLDSDVESLGVTIMSYEERDDFFEERDLRIYDLAYLQYRYGVNKTARAGDDTYGFQNFDQSVSDGGVYIWDGAGIDTFDASNETVGVEVDLTPGTMSYRGNSTTIQSQNSNRFAVKGELSNNATDYFDGEVSSTDEVVYVEAVPEQAGLFNQFNGIEKVYDFTEDQVMIGYNTQIENLYGSDFADTLTGNNANNIIIAGKGNDTVNGGMGNDYLDGGAGADKLVGGIGDDIYVVDNANDQVSENSNQGSDVVFSTIDYTLVANLEEIVMLDGATIATGNALDNIMTGNNADNTISGGAGADIINGGTGSDELTGGAGKDTFVFSDVLDGSVDTITDFKVGEDSIQLSSTVFSSLNVGDKVNEFVVYDKATGELSYDSDGAGKVDAIHFATLDTGLNIDNSSFNVI